MDRYQRLLEVNRLKTQLAEAEAERDALVSRLRSRGYQYNVSTLRKPSINQMKIESMREAIINTWGDIEQAERDYRFKCARLEARNAVYRDNLYFFQDHTSSKRYY